MLKTYFSSYWIRSAFYTFLQRFSVTLFGFINFVLLVHDGVGSSALTKEQVGTWALFLTITAIFEATKSGLLKNAHIRYVTASSDTNEKVAVASTSFVINAAISALFILVILCFGNWMSHILHTGKDLANTLKWFIPGLIAMVFFSHLEAVQQSHLDFKGGFAGYFSRQLLFFFILFGHKLLHVPFTLAQLAMYQSICIGVGAVILFLYTKKYLHFQFKASVASMKKIVGYGGYIFGSGIMSNIFASVDQLMTAKVISGKSVSYYSVAARINSFIDIPSYAAAEILFPKISESSAMEGNSRVKYLYERMVAILISFTVPASLFVFLFPKLMIGLIAGTSYAAAVPILQLYVATGLMRPFLNQSANLLNSIGKPALCFVANTVSLAINLAVNYACLQEFGLYGAAIGTLITHVIGSIGWYFIMRKQVGFSLPNIFSYAIGVYKIVFGMALKLIRPKAAYAIADGQELVKEEKSTAKI